MSGGGNMGRTKGSGRGWVGGVVWLVGGEGGVASEMVPSEAGELPLIGNGSSGEEGLSL